MFTHQYVLIFAINITVQLSIGSVYIKVGRGREQSMTASKNLMTKVAIMEGTNDSTYNNISLRIVEEH